VAFYSFFIHLSYKKYLYRENKKIELNILVVTSSPMEFSSKENKILLDLKHRNMMHLYSFERSFSFATDLEGKILGHKPTHDQKLFSNVTNATINLNKKLLHSTVFGSIKLIRI
jgi:hypothetical protein